MAKKDVYDLRKVLDELKKEPGQYHETNVEVDPDAELSGVYVTLVLVEPFNGLLKRDQQ